MKHPLNDDLNLEHYCELVLHMTTGKIMTKYSNLANDPETREVWTTVFGKEFGSLNQGNNRTGAKDTNSLWVLTYQGIRDTPHLNVRQIGR